MSSVRIRLTASFLALAAGIVAVLVVVDLARSILG
jgi:hypothetical protein